jgi:dTDP-4-amino-4,6-dideoxygalactose transaminase
VAPGINGKMSEFNAALGVLQLEGIDKALAKRAAVDRRYRAGIAGLAGIGCLAPPADARSNHSYFPILVEPDYPLTRDELYQKFRDHNIFVRRYFYPLISDFPMYRGLPSAAHDNLPVARRISAQVLCLPIYPDLTLKQVDRIVDLLRPKSS